MRKDETGGAFESALTGIDEARALGERLGCLPVIARAEAAGVFDVTPVSASGH